MSIHEIEAAKALKTLRKFQKLHDEVYGCSCHSCEYCSMVDNLDYPLAALEAYVKATAKGKWLKAWSDVIKET